MRAGYTEGIIDGFIFYLQKRAVEVAPIFERSAIKSWTEFCVRFAHSFPQVEAIVGSTSHIENLNEFLSATENIEPLPRSLIKEIEALQYKWSNELDMLAEPWTL